MEGCHWEGQNIQLKEVQRLMKKKPDIIIIEVPFCGKEGILFSLFSVLSSVYSFFLYMLHKHL